MDVKSAFLNCVLDEEIYMEQPQGFIMPGTETKVCHLKRAIYSLKQASHTWNIQFHGFLTGIGFTRTHANAGVYVDHQQQGDGPLIVILYVDDITILGSSIAAVDCLKAQIAKQYEVTDLGEIESYLGVTTPAVTPTFSSTSRPTASPEAPRDTNPSHVPLGSHVIHPRAPSLRPMSRDPVSRPRRVRLRESPPSTPDAPDEPGSSTDPRIDSVVTTEDLAILQELLSEFPMRPWSAVSDINGHRCPNQ